MAQKKTTGKREVPKSKSKSAAAKTKSTKQTKASKHKKDIARQRTAIILFAAALLLLCIALIPGGNTENVWSVLYSGLRGIFGLCAFPLPIFLGYIAVNLAKGGEEKTWIKRSWQFGVLLLLIAVVLEVFTARDPVSYGAAIQDAYHRGSALFGEGKINGGVLGALLGYPLLAGFGKIGGRIIAVLALLVFVMLVSGLTLLAVLRPVGNTAKKVKTHIQEQTEKRRAGRIDIDLGEGYAPPPPKTASYTALESATNQLHEEQNEQESVTEIIDRLAWEIASQPPAKRRMSDLEFQQQTDAVTEEIKETSQQPAFYAYPSVTLLKETPKTDDYLAREEMQKNAALLVQTLSEFGISAKVVDISRGPTVTRYELKPNAGVKISRITGLADDIALRLATGGVRIEAPIPHKAAIGIEVPNQVTAAVGLRELIDSPEFRSQTGPLTVALGRDIAGHIVTADLAKMPHLLIAGTTGSGKSVCTNAMIQSILFRSSPEEVRMILIDPKQVEFSVYNGIPHLLVPVVTDPRKAAGALGWAVTEMLDRYKQFAEKNVRDITAYNRLAETDNEIHSMPLILIVIDELSDLMMAAGKEVEDAIVRLAQMARAAGMHLVIATQRPSVDVITGLIKANIPSRLALTVASATDSRTILDAAGADKLLGRGDMLFHPLGIPKPIRVQGCFVSDSEIESVVNFLKASSSPEYDEEVVEEINRQALASEVTEEENNLEVGDDMLPQAVEVVLDAGQASISLIQRKLSLGYARAGRIIDEMEQRGIVGPHEGSKPRKVLITRQQWLEMQTTRSDAGESL